MHFSKTEREKNDGVHGLVPQVFVFEQMEKLHVREEPRVGVTQKYSSVQKTLDLSLHQMLPTIPPAQAGSVLP